jgi:hypothetical protein
VQGRLDDGIGERPPVLQFRRYGVKKEYLEKENELTPSIFTEPLPELLDGGIVVK